MNTRHFWFRCRDYSLLGHLDPAQVNRGGPGVLIVPSFGWEDVCSYRPLRFMARIFAQMGLPTLRYDLPGTGDSSGDARDPGLFESWIHSVTEAAAVLRDAAGVKEVAVVGIHTGAMLALIAASRGENFRQLVLWGASARGRDVLRELRALAHLEGGDYYAGGRDAPPQPIPGFEAGGFLISPETLAALEAVDLTALPLPESARILLLSRDDLPHDTRLRDALHASPATVEMSTGRGYSAMMSTPQGSLCPDETGRLIGEFLSQDDRPYRRPAGAAHSGHRAHSARRRGTVSTLFDARTGEIRALESIYPIERSPLGLFGILTEPATAVNRSDYCVLFLNAGGVRHTGPNRMWVESARRWAERGVASLRLDLEGLGESEGAPSVDVPSLYQNRMVNQIEIAIDSLRRLGVTRFIAVGLCSGACWGFHSAVRNPDVRAAILVNPSLLAWDPGADRRRILRSVSSGFVGWAEWTRIVRSGIQRRDLQGAARRTIERLGRKREKEGDGYLQLGFESLAEAWLTLELTQKRVTLVFREGEALLGEMELSGQLPPNGVSTVRCIRTPDGGHTFRPLWAQKLLHELIDNELARTISPSLPAAPPPDRASALELDRTCATVKDL